MFNEDDRVTVINQCIERLHQLADVMEMKACCWFVKDEQHSFGTLFLAEVKGKLNALTFSS